MTIGVGGDGVHRPLTQLDVIRAFGTPTNGLWAAEEVEIHVEARDPVAAVAASTAAHDTLVALHRTLPADAPVRAPLSWLARQVIRVLGPHAHDDLHTLREHADSETAPTVEAPLWTPPRPNVAIRTDGNEVVGEVHLPSGLAMECTVEQGLLTVTLRIAAASHNLGLWAHEYNEDGECIDTTAIDVRAGSPVGHAILRTATPHRLLVGPWADPPDLTELARDTWLDVWRGERFCAAESLPPPELAFLRARTMEEYGECPLGFELAGPIALAESLAGPLADALEGVDASLATPRDRYLAAATTTAAPRPWLVGWVLDHARDAGDEDAAALALEMALTIDEDDASAAALDVLLHLRGGRR